MRILLVLLCPIVWISCSVSKNSYSPNKKYSPEQLQKDYSLYRAILETHHPSLYWYTSKDSMDHYFNVGEQKLKDSMTEAEFRKVLSYVTAKINCGHTSVRSSKAALKYIDTTRAIKIFPLSMKLWDDTMVVAANLNRRDSILRRGTIIKSINNRTTKQIIDSLFNHISTDGYNTTHKYQTLSNRGFFGSLYTSVYGISDKYTIDYVDSAGNAGTVVVPVFIPTTDTARRAAIRPVTSIPQPSRKERQQQRLANMRLLQMDTVNRSAMMTVSSFGRGYRLKKFFRQSFRELERRSIEHLIIDVRSNGGGSVTNSTLITRFLSDHRFKIGDSLYAVRKRSRYSSHIENNTWNNLFMIFFTGKKKDGKYHFGYFERHYFKPKKKNHFDGQAYIVTGGNSFSATTLFASALMKQDNITVVGEETGGGAYGNSAWLIPDATLPITGVRFRLPLFRLVIDKTVPKDGRGVIPEVESKPTIENIRKGTDFKIEKVMEMIKEDQEKKRQH
ncbi:MAG TPA: S41 family peptidase [Chitinophagaceae bacterium]